MRSTGSCAALGSGVEDCSTIKSRALNLWLKRGGRVPLHLTASSPLLSSKPGVPSWSKQSPHPLGHIIMLSSSLPDSLPAEPPASRALHYWS